MGAVHAATEISGQATAIAAVWGPKPTTIISTIEYCLKMNDNNYTRKFI
jgi:hypothetical protein